MLCTCTQWFRTWESRAKHWSLTTCIAWVYMYVAVWCCPLTSLSRYSSYLNSGLFFPLPRIFIYLVLEFVLYIDWALHSTCLLDRPLLQLVPTLYINPRCYVILIIVGSVMWVIYIVLPLVVLVVSRVAGLRPLSAEQTRVRRSAEEPISLPNLPRVVARGSRIYRWFPRTRTTFYQYLILLHPQQLSTTTYNKLPTLATWQPSAWLIQVCGFYISEKIPIICTSPPHCLFS